MESKPTAEQLLKLAAMIESFIAAVKRCRCDGADIGYLADGLAWMIHTHEELIKQSNTAPAMALNPEAAYGIAPGYKYV